MWNTMKFQSDYLTSNKDFLKKYHSHLMEDDDPLFFLTDEQPEKKKATSDGLNEIDVEPPKRQDTEADIAIGRHISTD